MNFLIDFSSLVKSSGGEEYRARDRVNANNTPKLSVVACR
jgi:hypothetical protein